MKRPFYISFLCLFLVTQAKAQFSLSGEFRPRTEYSHGFGTLAAEDQKASLFTSQRTRLNFDFKMDLLKVGLVLQDVRTWGSQPQQVANQDFATSVHQAWAEINFTPEISLKAGRQELAYDDHRILGNVAWAQQARSHDVALFKYAKKVNVHLGIAHHENTNRKDNIYDGPDAYKNLQFLWINQKTAGLSWSLLFLNNGKPVTEGIEQKSKYSQTFGTHLEIPMDKLAFSGNFYFQTGEDGARKSLNAYNLMAEATYKSSEKTQWQLGYEILSGTDYDIEEKNASFTPLYGTNHKFNGFMDYFYVGNHLSSVGLADAFAKFATSKNKTTFNADLHFFASTAKISETADNYLGTEIDLSLTQTINPATKITFGYSQMFGSESLEILKGGSKGTTNNWAYLMISVTPKFIP
ncbi:MAG: hypothetical protein Q7J86_15935 [Bacteroidota bacterium]|nr:hypothetical protein [Bacteroidota bacterium]